MKALRYQLVLLGAVMVCAVQARAAGYEKSIMWGGLTGSVAGISTSYISGADSLYFNPAGLAKDTIGQDLSFNISPVWSSFSGPYNNNDDVVTSNTNFATPLSLIYSNTLNDKWAFGVGGFISGGSKVSYDNIDFAGAINGTPSTKTDLQIAELSAGVAYKVNDRLKFGASYRYAMARANFAFLNRVYTTTVTPFGPPGTFLGVLNASLDDLKDQESGFKIGAQYKIDDATHLGLVYRSEIAFDASGGVSGTFYKNSAIGPISNGGVAAASAVAHTVFPQAVTLGADHSFSDFWKGLIEVAWTNYARVDKITTNVSTTASYGAGNLPVQDPSITQNWKDQWNVRLGAQYAAWSWPLRFGYGLTTQVTNSDWARPTFTPPGASHTFTVGTGHSVDLGGQKLDFNGAGEYTFVAGDGTGHAAGDNTASTNSDIRAGSYKTSAYALHLGLAYNF